MKRDSEWGLYLWIDYVFSGKLPAYRNLPKYQKQIASNAWVRELLYQSDVDTIKKFLDRLLKFNKRTVITKCEIKSNFWYLVLKKRPVATGHKIENANFYFQYSRQVLDSKFWPLMALTSQDFHFQEIITGLQKKCISLEIKNAIKKIENSDETLLTRREFEQYNSLDGLMSLLINFHIETITNKNSTFYLTEATSTFLRIFAFKFYDDYAFDVLNMIKVHLSITTKADASNTDNSVMDEQRIQTFSDIKSKHHLSVLLEIMRIKAELRVSKKIDEHAGLEKLTYFTHLKFSEYFS